MRSTTTMTRRSVGLRRRYLGNILEPQIYSDDFHHHVRNVQIMASAKTTQNAYMGPYTYPCLDPDNATGTLEEGRVAGGNCCNSCYYLRSEDCTYCVNEVYVKHRYTATTGQGIRFVTGSPQHV